LSRRLFPEHARHNLDAVIERHGLACSARHRALGDAQVLKDLWLKLKAEIPADVLAAAAAHAALSVPKLPRTCRRTGRRVAGGARSVPFLRR